MSDRKSNFAVVMAFVLFFAFLLFFIVLMGNAQAEGATVMTITADHVREREEPSLDAYVTGHYNTGDKVKVLSIEDDWALLDNGYYVFASFLSEGENEPEVISYNYFVIAPGARERTAPNVSSDNIVCEHLAGDVVQVVSPAINGWHKLANGNYISEGMISTNYEDIFAHCAEHYRDILIVSISRQHAIFYHYNAIFESDVVTGHATKSPTPLGLYMAGRKIRGVNLNGNKDTYVAYGVYFEKGFLVHDAESFPWRITGFGGEIYKTNGSNGCINTPTAFSKIFYDYCSECTYVLIIP